MAVSDLWYEFASVPIITNVSGCQSGRVDSDSSVFVSTVDCPTAGNQTITVSGYNFKLPLQIQIGPYVVLSSSTTKIFSTGSFANTYLIFQSPQGVGQAMTVTVRRVCLFFVQYVTQ